MPKEQAGSDNPDQGQAGDDHKMSSDPTTSINTSSPTEEVSESLTRNGDGSEQTHTDKDESPGSLLNFPLNSTGSSSTSPSLEEEHEFTLRLHMRCFGKQVHLDKMIAAILHDLCVTGHEVYAAYLGDEDVTEKYHDDKDRRWDHPQFKGYFPPEVTA